MTAVSAAGAAGAHLVQAAADVGEVVEAHADRAEQQRRLPAALVRALRDAQLLRLAVPQVYGGPEADPITMLRCIESVATADGAAGWCTMIASTTSSLSMFMHPEFAEQIFADPKVVTGGVFAPNGTATTRGDNWVVDGRWMWGSGTQHCQWICGGTRTDDGGQQLMFFAADDVTIHDTWHTSGLRGTGSNDFSVHRAKVPKGRAVTAVGARRQVDVPLAAFPNFTLLAIGVAGVTLGIARRALDEFVELAVEKQPQFSSRTIAQTGTAQSELARAEASLRAARSYLYEQVAAAWDTVVAGGKVGVDTRAAIRLAGAHCAETAAAVVDRVFTMAGGAAVFDSNQLQRCLRDVHVATQHIMVAPRLYETMGKHLFGLDVDTTML